MKECQVHALNSVEGIKKNLKHLIQQQ